MLIDGLKLTEFGPVLNSKFESGTVLPTEADEGSSFVLLQQQGDNTPGLYYYKNATWELVGSVQFSFDDLDFETTQVGNTIMVALDYTKVAARDYVDQVVQNLAVKTYVDGADATVLATARAYTDGVATAANAHADTVSANALQTAQTYADAIAQSIDPKASVRLATTAEIVLADFPTIDGVTPTAGDRVLVKNQTDATKNGIYVAASGTWARATDANTSTKVSTGLTTTAEDGLSNASTTWLLTSKNVILGTTALNFTLYGASVAADNVTIGKVNNTLFVKSEYTPYDVGSCVMGLPNPGDAVLRFAVVRAFKLPAGLSGSLVFAEIAATDTAVFLLKKNGAQIGAFTFAAGATTATLTFATQVTFSAGDKITIEAPDTQDATLSDVSFTFMGNLQ